MVVLYVHGMGRTPLSAWPLMHRLRKSGIKTRSFFYISAFEDFDSIVSRLNDRILKLAANGPYVVIGHSLGGVLLRATLNALPQDTALPKHVYLLGSPILSPRLAMKLKRNILFRIFTGDCGQLLGSPVRMAAIDAIEVPTTGIVGVRGFARSSKYFGEEENDGFVSVNEANAVWLTELVRVQVVHTMLPSSRFVSEIIMHCLAKMRIRRESKEGCINRD